MVVPCLALLAAAKAMEVCSHHDKSRDGAEFTVRSSDPKISKNRPSIGPSMAQPMPTPKNTNFHCAVEIEASNFYKQLKCQ